MSPFLDSALLSGRILAAAGELDRVADLIGGDLQLALAHGEPTSRYDLNYVRTTAVNGISERTQSRGYERAGFGCFDCIRPYQRRESQMKTVFHFTLLKRMLPD